MNLQAMLKPILFGLVAAIAYDKVLKDRLPF